MISTRLRVKELLRERRWTTKVLAEKQVCLRVILRISKMEQSAMMRRKILGWCNPRKAASAYKYFLKMFQLLQVVNDIGNFF